LGERKAPTTWCGTALAVALYIRVASTIHHPPRRLVPTVVAHGGTFLRAHHPLAVGLPPWSHAVAHSGGRIVLINFKMGYFYFF
jgi:hypothetical protein